MLVSAIIIAFYFWATAAGVNTEQLLLVSTTSAYVAGASFIVGLVSYLWLPRQFAFWGALTAYIILAITTAMLLLTSGGITSPFIALWMIVAVFSGVFGAYGILPLFLAITGYLIFQFTQGTLSHQGIITAVLAGELPLAISYLLWHTRPAGDTKDRAYRQLATELSEVANKSEVVINAIADGVVALNNQGIIQLINPAAQQIIGWGKQDALALDYKSVLKLVDKDGKDIVPGNDPIAEALATNKQVKVTNLSLLTTSDKKLLVSINVSPVGQLGSGVIIVFRDITKEKAEEREQAEFISTASHEMRTPVASIEGYLGLALNPATAQIDDKARDFINKAHEAAQHLGRLFQDLLDVSKAEDGRLSNNPKVVDVVAFVHDIVQGLRPHAETKGLRMLFKPLPDDNDRTLERRINPVFFANVDNDHLREVVSNLIENAIKYTPQGDVVIDVTGDNDHVTISIADSGIGIPKEDQAHLFQKFYRVDNSDTREIGGTGLGLYLCRRLAEAMNGRIWLDSEYKRGSTFYLELGRISHEDATRMIEAASVQNESTNTPLSFTPEPIAPPMPVTPPPPTSPVAPIPVAPVQTPAAAPIYYQPAAPQPQPQPQPQPIQQPTPAPQTYAPQQPASQLPNTPLTSIEQNPALYQQNRPDVLSVPPREQN